MSRFRMSFPQRRSLEILAVHRKLSHTEHEALICALVRATRILKSSTIMVMVFGVHRLWICLRREFNDFLQVKMCGMTVS